VQEDGRGHGLDGRARDGRHVPEPRLRLRDDRGPGRRRRLRRQVLRESPDGDEGRGGGLLDGGQDLAAEGVEREGGGGNEKPRWLFVDQPRRPARYSRVLPEPDEGAVDKDVPLHPQGVRLEPQALGLSKNLLREREW
jgi:hypothetical protein